MADKDLIRDNSTSIELYRLKDAAPEDAEQFRYWITAELRRIQGMGISIDSVLADLETSAGPEGPKGPRGTPGENGRDGIDGADGADGADATAADLIDDNRTLFGKTWSSQKINTFVNDLVSNLSESFIGIDLNNYYHGGDSSSVVFNLLGSGASDSDFSAVTSVHGGNSG